MVNPSDRALEFQARDVPRLTYVSHNLLQPVNRLPPGVLHLHRQECILRCPEHKPDHRADLESRMLVLTQVHLGTQGLDVGVRWEQSPGGIESATVRGMVRDI